MTDGLDQVGGLAVTSDCFTLYAGVSFSEGDKGIIKLSTNAETATASYMIVTKTPHQPNGMAADWGINVLYFTDEGTNSEYGGTVSSYNLEIGLLKIESYVPWADAAYFDSKDKMLYIGELITKKIHVFSTAEGFLVHESNHEGLSPLGDLHLLDDLTLEGVTNTYSLNSTVLIGADFTGKKIQRFSLDGSLIESIDPGLTIFEPTSIRWGLGPGFDPNSIYVTEGGGATKFKTDRRVFQIVMT